MVELVMMMAGAFHVPMPPASEPLTRLTCMECGRAFWTDDGTPLCSEHFIGPGARP